MPESSDPSSKPDNRGFNCMFFGVPEPSEDVRVAFLALGVAFFGTLGIESEPEEGEII